MQILPAAYQQIFQVKCTVSISVGRKLLPMRNFKCRPQGLSNFYLSLNHHLAIYLVIYIFICHLLSTDHQSFICQSSIYYPESIYLLCIICLSAFCCLSTIYHLPITSISVLSQLPPTSLFYLSLHPYLSSIFIPFLLSSSITSPNLSTKYLYK